MRSRLVIARILVVLGALLAAVAAIAGYVRYQVFDDETFETTATEFIADEAIRDEIAASLVDGLFTRVDVAARLENRLPEEQQGLAAPLAGALRSVADSQAQRLLERPRAQELWVEAATRARRNLERVLDDDTTVLQTDDGWLVVNVQPLVVQLGERVAIIGRVGNRLTGDDAVIRVMQVEQLQAAQDLTALFKFVAAWLWVVPLALWAIAIWLARGRRREEFRAVSIAIVCAGLLVLVFRAVAGRYVVDALAPVGSEQAAENAWSILTSLLADGGRTLAAVGLVALAGAWLVGPSRRAVAARERLAPYLERPEYAFGAGAAALLLLAWWGPTAQTQRLGWVLVMAVLLASGIEVLRRTAARGEPAPEAPTETSPST
jgi:hypothetical protein